ncbi:Oxysterol-binding protein 3 [Thecaphora frezii]
MGGKTETRPPQPDHHGTGDKQAIQDLASICTGWVLKKKRKKMQGYAKRFFALTNDGLLMYAMSPDKPARDAIEIPHASVTSSKKHGTIHVDSGSSVFHLKMLNDQDFELWRTHLRSFIPERTAGPVQKVYVASGTDLVAVDVSQIYASLEIVEQLVGNLAQKSASSRVKIAQQTATGAVLGAISMKNTHDSDDAEGLVNTIDQLKDEFANLKYAIESSIPRADGPAGTMKSIQSRPNIMDVDGHTRSRMSVSSFNTNHSDSAIFYDADDLGGDELAGDEIHKDGDLSRSDTSEAEDRDDDDSAPETDDTSSHNGSSKGAVVEYRKKLPAKVSGDEVSLFSMLKKNVGKDLSTISFPVSFNCPLSLLQAAAEEYEYAANLLEKAAKTEDWVERICLVGAFAVSGYSSTKLRASRKPFNPLLGETYECVREDKHFRFIAEKVVHQPPVVASYIEGKGWKCQGWSAVKNKFWGKSLELIPEGSMRLEFGDGDIFSFQKPSSFMRNLLAGNKYLEHVGELTVTNENTGQRIVIEFKEGTMWGGTGSRNHVVGTVYDANDQEVTHVKGKWSDHFSRQHDKENYQVLWEAAEMPPHAEEYYGFTYFAMTLNELSDDCRDLLPPTDSRLRPDQRAFEEGNVQEAESLKHKLEEAQRARRRDYQNQGTQHQPKWFHQQQEEPQWVFGGAEGEDYWKARKKKAEGEDVWKDVPRVFEV